MKTQFDSLIEIVKKLDQKNQKAATLLLGFVQKWTKQVPGIGQQSSASILVNDDQEMLNNFKSQ